MSGDAHPRTRTPARLGRPIKAPSAWLTVSASQILPFYALFLSRWVGGAWAAWKPRNRIGRINESLGLFG